MKIINMTAQLWHPCTAMKDLENFPPISIQSAKGSYLYTTDGQEVIDANSSWWCKILGHAHPRLQTALQEQMTLFEHVIVPNTHQSVLEKLIKYLAKLRPELCKASFASDGSCAIEMAVKLALHAKQILGQNHRQHFMALNGSYHGETGFALSLTEIPFFRQMYTPLLFSPRFIQQVPYVNSITDEQWDDCHTLWPSVLAQLEPHVNSLAAIIVEPIVQGSHGMRIYSKDFLRRLREFTHEHDIYLIADEIFTSFGRTGTALACDHANITPDILCLGKGMTAGFLPMSAMLTTQEIYDLFYVDYDPMHTFVHSHTYSGHALAAAVACATFEILEEEKIYAKVQQQSQSWADLMYEVAEATGKLQNIRHLGAIVAADINSTQPRLGFEVFRRALPKGAFLRPLGNTIYWTPPLNTPYETIQKLRDITIAAIRETCA
jgi:adenosylmethionine-8-amino-7-oxononanoate aminotransferase